MAKFLPPVWFMHLLDNNGELLNGGKIYTYAGGTTTDIATYTDSGGLTSNTNPIVLDSAGRASLWITADTAYKFVVKTSADVTLFSVDNVTTVGDSAASDEEIEICFSYVGTPGAQGCMGTYAVTRSLTLPVDLAGSYGSVGTDPASTFLISVQKNGVEVGTVSIGTDGVFTFATTGGATASFVAGDALTLVGPASVGTATDFGITLIGDVA